MSEHSSSPPGPGALGRILVIVPTYNEMENLPRLLPAVLDAAPVEVLVADDNSPDGTGALADRLAAADPRIHVMHRTEKSGLGAAYLAGFAWALDHGFDVVVEMDADGSHRPKDLPLLLDALEDSDLVLGSRYVPGGEVVNWPRSREILSRGGNSYVRLMMDVPLQDATGGFRAFRAETLRTIGLDSVDSQGYVFQVDMAHRAVSQGMRVREVPITFVEREYGTSKMSRRIVLEAMWRVTVWGYELRRDRRRARRSTAGV